MKIKITCFLEQVLIFIFNILITLQKQIKDGRKKGTLTEDEIMKLEDELEELQTS